MSDERFDLVFKGELARGAELQQAKQNLKALFRITDEQVESLFSGKPITLKKGVDAAAANTYRVAMKKAGALVNVVASAAPSKTQTSKPASSTEAAAPARTPSAGVSAASEGDAVQTALGAQPDKPHEPRKPIASPDFGVAELGTDLVSEAEISRPQPVVVDVSHISVAEQSGHLVSEDELMRLPVLEIDVPEIDVAPAGSDVLKPEERPEAIVANVDTSAYSVAEAGERLSAPKAPAPKAPNVDHIKLAD